MVFNVKRGRWLQAAVFLGLPFCFLLFLGCAQENQPIHKPVSLKVGGCLDEMQEQGQKLTKVVMKPYEVNQFWQCPKNLVKTFRLIVKTSDGTITPQVISAFWKQYVSSSSQRTFNLTPALLKSVFQLKPLFLGGSTDYLTKEELTQLEVLLEELGPLTQSIQPFLPELTSFSSWSAEKKYAFSQKIKEVLNWLEESFVQRKDQTNFKLFLGHVSQVLGSGSIGQGLSKYQKIILDFKQFFVGTTNLFLSEDWKKTFEALNSTIDLFLLFEQARPFPLESGEFFTYWGEFSFAAWKVVGKGLSQQENQEVPFSFINQVLNHLNEVDLFSDPFGMKLVRELWKWGFRDAFRARSSEEKMSLNQDIWKRIAVQLHDFVLVQRKIVKGESFADVPRIKHLIEGRPWVPAWDERIRLKITGQPEEMDAFSLTVMNALSFVTDMLVYEYTGSRLQEVENDRLRLFIDDLIELLFQFDINLKNGTDYTAKVLKEASLFLPSSRGKDRLNYQELSEYLAYALTGFQNLFFVRAQSADCWDRSKEINIPQTCYVDKVFEHREELMKPWPMLLSYLNLKTMKEQKEIYNQVLSIVLAEELGFVPLMDGMEFFGLLQYVETVLVRFDKDQSGDLNLEEAKNSYQIFENVFRSLIGYEEEHYSHLALSTYTFLMKKGRVGDSAFDQLEFLYWVRFPQKWTLKSDRKLLLDILHMLAKQ